jgi:dihydroorotase
MLHYYREGRISLETIVRKMSHAVADCFQIKERGYIREGYFADLVLVDLNAKTKVERSNLYYKCGWSPLEGMTLPAQIKKTFVNGELIYANGEFVSQQNGMRLQFDR